MSFSYEIAKYELYYFGKEAKDENPIAQINLFDDSNRYIGDVFFHRDGQPIPNNSSGETSTPKQAYLKMHERQLNSVVDMLRNEKPCSVYYSNQTYARIYTGKEPVGKEES